MEQRIRSNQCLPLVGVLLMIGGCTVGPDYVRPTAPSAPAFKELEGWKIAQPQDETIRGTWWEIYGDPDLNALVEQVSVSDQTLLTAEAQFRQARALVWGARASWYPTAALGVSFAHTKRSENQQSGFSGGSSGGQSGSGNAFNDFTTPLSASWEPDLWGSIRRAVEANTASAQASAADVESARLSLQAELAADYFQLRALDSERALLDQTVTAYQKSVQLTQNRFDNGVASRVDVALAQTQLQTTQAQAIEIGVQRAQLEHAIAVLIGVPASSFSIAVRPLNQTPPPVPVGVPSEMLERRPDVAAAERTAAAANAQIGVAEAAFYPTVTLSGSVGFESSDWSNWLTWPSRFFTFGPSATETVFDGGLRQAQTAQARAAYEATVASYRQTVLAAFQDAEDNLAALRILEEESRVQDEAVASAQESVQLTTNRYKEGAASYLDVVVTQTAALNNERTAVDIVGRRMMASVRLVQALGGGWDASTLPSGHELAKDRPLWP
jgi:NodT family efflux transporter outer membrane factor (OMF) lipoprotein